MSSTFETKTFSLTIKSDPKAVYEFVANPENMPKWATAFCRSAKKEGSDWIITTDMGPAKVKFVDKNEYGILDHYVYPTPDLEVYVPMRVVPNKSGSEVLFTLFKLSFMNDEKFRTDIGLVERDLNTLKKVMES